MVMMLMPTFGVLFVAAATVEERFGTTMPEPCELLFHHYCCNEENQLAARRAQCASRGASQVVERVVLTRTRDWALDAFARASEAKPAGVPSSTVEE